MDIDINRLRYLDEIMPANVTTIYCDPHSVHTWAAQADLIVGAVLVPGGRTPILINRPFLSKMKPGSVIVDVCVDQGGCVETCRPTTHHDPVYVVDGIVHYCVANIPGAVPRTSTQALCNATLPYVRSLAGMGPEEFARTDAGQRAAINIADGRIVCEPVAQAFPDLAAG
jgi:alanine dehydrogenase